MAVAAVITGGLLICAAALFFTSDLISVGLVGGGSVSAAVYVITWHEVLLRQKEDVPESVTRKESTLAKEWLSTRIEECSQSYPTELLKEAFQINNKKEQWWAFAVIAPFAIRFFHDLQGDRQKVFIWLQEHPDEIFTFILPLLFPGKEEKFDALREELTFLFTSFLKILAPLQHFDGGEAYPGKDFLVKFLHQICFQIVPPLLKKEESSILLSYVFPFLSHFIYSPEQDLDDYLRVINEARAMDGNFSGEEMAALEKAANYQELLAFPPTLNKLFQEIMVARHEVLDVDLPPFLKQLNIDREVGPFIESGREMLKHVNKKVREILGNSVSSIGEFQAKNYLIAHEWTDLQEIEKEIVPLFISVIKEADIDVEILKDFSEKEGKKFSTEFKSFFNKHSALVKLSSPQDMILALLIGCDAIRYLHKLRPWLAKHQKAFLALLRACKVEEIISHEKAVRWLLWCSLKLLVPLNGISLGSWPGKSKVIRTSVNKIFSWLVEHLKDPSLLLNLQPLILFVMLGLFGSKDREKEAFKHFETKLLTFYRTLYNFPLKECVDSPDTLKGHIQKQLDSLLKSSNEV